MISRLVDTPSVDESIGFFGKNGVDVLVCTQRVFSYIDNIDVLSLLIIDEEQRFGVEQKELFVNTFPSVDLLYMSATPIPRSLQQAFSGIKTISTISSPPKNRRPIQTRVVFFDFNKISSLLVVGSFK